MVLPMSVLAVLALLSGLMFQYVWDLPTLLGVAISHSGESLSTETAHVSHGFVPMVSTFAALSGIILAFLIYTKKVISANSIFQTFKPIHYLLEKRYFIDEFFIYGFVKPADIAARALYFFDYKIYDRFIIDGSGFVTDQFAKVNNLFDRYVVDGLVNVWGFLAQFSSGYLKKVQSGLVQNYILFIVLGFGVLILLKLHIGFHEFINLF